MTDAMERIKEGKVRCDGNGGGYLVLPCTGKASVMLLFWWKCAVEAEREALDSWSWGTLIVYMCCKTCRRNPFFILLRKMLLGLSRFENMCEYIGYGLSSDQHICITSFDLLAVLWARSCERRETFLLSSSFSRTETRRGKIIQLASEHNPIWFQRVYWHTMSYTCTEK